MRGLATGLVDRERRQIRETIVVQGGSKIMLFSLYSFKHDHGPLMDETTQWKVKVPGISCCTVSLPDLKCIRCLNTSDH
jgi:hypothetical protein